MRASALHSSFGVSVRLLVFLSSHLLVFFISFVMARKRPAVAQRVANARINTHGIVAFAVFHSICAMLQLVHICIAYAPGHYIDLSTHRYHRHMANERRKMERSNDETHTRDASNWQSSSIVFETRKPANRTRFDLTSNDRRSAHIQRRKN